MPGNPAHRSLRRDTEHTAQIPVIAEGRGRHAAGVERSGHWYVSLLIAGATAAVVLGLLVAYVASGGSDGSGTPNAIATEPDGGQQALPSDAVASEMASPTPSASPVPTTSPMRSQNPAALIDQLQTTLRGLTSSKRLSRNAGKEPSRRLEEAELALAKGDIATARAMLADFSEGLTALRQEGKLSPADYQKLTALVTQLIQALPASRPN